MAQIEDCGCTENQPCGECKHKHSTICILHEGVRLTTIDTYKGENLESILDKIDALFKQLNDAVFAGSSYLNVGGGSEVFSKVNAQSKAEFRTLVGGVGISLVQNLETIGISINEAYINNLISQGESADINTTMTNLVSGKRIATYTNEEGSTYDIDETITTFVDNGNGSFTYTNEQGTSVTFSANGLETITALTNVKAGNRIGTYTNENGVSVDIDETITNLVNNNDNTLTYTKEDGTTASYSPLSSSTVQKGVIETATNLEVQAGTDNERAITPSGLSSRTATETRTGILETATQAESDALSAVDKIVTPGTIPIASETQQGLSERATQAEVDAGTDTTRYVTPATLQSKLDDEIGGISAGLQTTTVNLNTSSWGDNQELLLSHNIGSNPITAFMTATVVSGSQEGWVVGDRVQITPNAHNYENETDGGVTIQFTSTTQFRLIIGDVIVALNK
ncbi:MAG: hypothetical protein CMH22_06400, partial [Methylophaga sp.]|nr:hypothetical protein [Methylophaga sp.]